MAHVRGPRAGRRQPDLAPPADPRRGRRSHTPRHAAFELRGFHHRREQRQQPGPRHAGHSLRPVGTRRHRGEAAAQGRRLRKRERPIRAAGRARSPRSRRSFAGRGPQVHPARDLDGAGQRVQPGCRRRRDWGRPHRRVSTREGAVVPHARRREPGPAPGRPRTPDHDDGQQPRYRHDGLRRDDVTDWLQDRRDQPVARELFLSPSRTTAGPSVVWVCA